MTFRLIVATFAVAGVAYVSSPFIAFLAFMALAGIPICYSSWNSLQDTSRQSLVPPR